MSRPVSFDRALTDALAAEAQSIAPPSDMGYRVTDALATRRQAGGLPFLRGLGWKLGAAAACLLLVGVTGPLAFSPGVRAWADGKVGELVNRSRAIYRMADKGALAKGEEPAGLGEYLPPEKAGQAPAGGVKKTIQVINSKYSTKQEAEARAGFKFMVPTYLPEGYHAPSVYRVGQPKAGTGSPGGSSQVSMQFSDRDGLFRGLALLVSQSGRMPQPKLFTETTVNGQPARWFETDIELRPAPGAASQTARPPESKLPPKATEHRLVWRRNGVTYSLSDYDGLPQEEMLKIAASLR